MPPPPAPASKAVQLADDGAAGRARAHVLVRRGGRLQRNLEAASARGGPPRHQLQESASAAPTASDESGSATPPQRTTRRVVFFFVVSCARAVVGESRSPRTSSATEKPRVGWIRARDAADSGVEVGSSSAPPRGAGTARAQQRDHSRGTAGASTSVFEDVLQTRARVGRRKPADDDVAQRARVRTGGRADERFRFRVRRDASSALNVALKDAVSLTNVAPRTRITAACAFDAGSASTSVSTYRAGHRVRIVRTPRRSS